jgi:hypothetical protein
MLASGVNLTTDVKPSQHRIFRFWWDPMTFHLLRLDLATGLSNLMNSITFVLFSKYYPIVDQLDSKDSSRDFHLNCVISYFLPTFNVACMRPKIDVMERGKKF